MFAFSKVKIGIIISLVVATTTLGWLYRTEVRRAASQAHTIVQQLIALDDLERRVLLVEEERARVLEIVNHRDAELQILQRELKVLRNDIRKIIEEDEQSALWADEVIPSAILDRLNHYE